MPFTNFAGLAIMGLLMAVISIRTIYQTIRDREKLFDDDFTRADRQHMSVAAFFMLLPVSVLFHEVGHAVAILLYGGDVTAFGFFFFFGFVGYEGITDAVELFWIALWGNLVSIAMGLAALLLAFLRPMRSAINYLLIMFGIISILQSLVFYPMMDVLSDLHGDWSQIYTWDTTAHSIGMGIVHGAILLGMVIAYQTSRVRLRFAEITGLRPEEIRKVNRNQAQEEITRAAEAAIEQFDGLARLEQAGSSRDAVSVRITWTSGGYNRSVVIIGILRGQLRLEIYGAARALDGTEDGGEQRIRGLRGIPEPERVTPYILRAMKQVEGWQIVRSDGSTGHQA
ncbi:MAG: hypothetical protein WD401_05180 [Thermomicrobiaceae bacterium]